MKRYLNKPVLLLILFFQMLSQGYSQVLEWRLTNPVYVSADPDGAGPAEASVNFALQIHTQSGTAQNISGISTGWSWQAGRIMLPTTGTVAPTCGTTSLSQPSNVAVAPALAALGYNYNYVNQCSGSVNIVSNNQTFDRRAVGILDGGSAGFAITTAWMDIFTVTLWTKDNTSPQGGYVLLNSGSGGTTGAFPTYAVSDIAGNEYVVNSLTYSTPLPLTSSTLPVSLKSFGAQCEADRSTSITWSTAQETGSNYFEVEKSSDAITWTSLAKVAATGYSNVVKNYGVNDGQGGAAFYRLKQVDKDGKIVYSNIVRTYCDKSGVYVTLYPVPAKDNITIVIGADKAAKATLQIFDSRGAKVKSVEVNVVNGSNSFTLNVQQLPVGQYLLKTTGTAFEISKRFMVMQ